MPIPGPFRTPTTTTPGDDGTTPTTTPGTTPGTGARHNWWLAFLDQLGILTPEMRARIEARYGGTGTPGTTPGTTPAVGGGWGAGGGKSNGGWWGPGAYSTYANIGHATTPGTPTTPGTTPTAGTGNGWWEALVNQLGGDPNFPIRTPASGSQLWGLGSGSVAGSSTAAGTGAAGSSAPGSVPAAAATSPTNWLSWFR